MTLSAIILAERRPARSRTERRLIRWGLAARGRLATRRFRQSWKSSA